MVMKSILYIKGSPIDDVRLRKFISFLEDYTTIYFWGWNRLNVKQDINENIKYILTGGGYSSFKLFFYYPLWVIKLFFKALFSREISKYSIICINFECGFPIYLVSKFRKLDFIYEIYDEFAISHNFPSFFRKIIVYLDSKIMNSAKYVIHVDKNRDRYKNNNTIIIENTPDDYFECNTRDYSEITHTFAVTGLLNTSRGINHILTFAKKNPNVQILAIGREPENEIFNDMKMLPNILFHKFMPQKDVFTLLQNCCGIFSLYNPNVEINKLAASNKVYDAMMLGIPVITNCDVINSKFIIDNNIGFVINYSYDESWDFLASKDYLSKVPDIGNNGRQLYLSQYQFSKLVITRLLNLLN